MIYGRLRQCAANLTIRICLVRRLVYRPFTICCDVISATISAGYHLGAVS